MKTAVIYYRNAKKQKTKKKKIRFSLVYFLLNFKANIKTLKFNVL